MKTFIVCKHPQSSQVIFDLISHLSSVKKSDAFFVYGLQNTTPNLARSNLSPNVTVKCASDERLDVEDLQREIVQYRPDTLLIMSSLPLVSAVIEMLLPKLLEMQTHVALYVDTGRTSQKKVHWDRIKGARDALKGRLSVYARDSPNATRLEYGSLTLKEKIGKDDAKNMLGFPSERKFVLALGRVDTAIIMFSHVAKEYPDATLLLPVDVGSKDMIADIYMNEMGDLASEERITLVKNMATLNTEELGILFGALDCVVYSNYVGDFNPYIQLASSIGVPQVIPEDKCEAFTFYAFDDEGGKVHMYDAADLAKLVCEALGGKAEASLGAGVSWDGWVDILKEVEGDGGESELERCKRELEELRRQLNKSGQ